MSYAEVEHIQEEFKQVTFSEDENSIAEPRVERFIEEASSEIDSAVGMKYVTPVNQNASCAPLLRSYCIAIVADRVRNILANKTARTEEEQDNGANTAKWAREQLKQIMLGNLKLDGATLLSSSDGVALGVSKCSKHIFQHGRKQW